ncbi:hypothetical protein [Nocardia sp. NPDC050175]|uniref:hypothetical protein n=1 Tax=Nocardia sp. NPDC050175 TaxID=3364317 RepID=UPI0037A658C0
MQHKIAHGGNTLIPAILAIEAGGFRITEQGTLLVATDGTDTYVADDPVALLGLIKLVELRGWSWQASDDEVDTTLARFGWTR